MLSNIKSYPSYFCIVSCPDLSEGLYETPLPFKEQSSVFHGRPGSMDGEGKLVRNPIGNLRYYNSTICPVTYPNQLLFKKILLFFLKTSNVHMDFKLSSIVHLPCTRKIETVINSILYEFVCFRYV